MQTILGRKRLCCAETIVRLDEGYFHVKIRATMGSEECIVSEHDFIEQLIDLMDTEEDIGMDTLLENIEEWDSLSYVAFLAMCTKLLNRRVEPQKVREAKTVRDLYEIITQ